MSLWDCGLQSPALGRCGEPDSQSTGEFDSTDGAVGEQKPQPRSVSGANSKRTPAAAWEDCVQRPGEVVGRVAGATRPQRRQPPAQPGPQPGSKGEPRGVAGLRFRVGSSCRPRSAHCRSAPAPALRPGQAVAARQPRGHMAEGDAGSDQRQVRPQRGADLQARLGLVLPPWASSAEGASARGHPRFRPHHQGLRLRHSLSRIPFSRCLISAHLIALAAPGVGARGLPLTVPSSTISTRPRQRRAGGRNQGSAPQPVSPAG